MRDNAILPPTASGDGAGARFVNTYQFLTLFFDWGAFSQKALRSHGGVGRELRRLY